MDNEQIHVTLIEDERDVREGLTVLINGSPGFRCIASFRTMEEALHSIWGQIPDVVLTDIAPGMSGIEGARVLKKHYPNTGRG